MCIGQSMEASGKSLFQADSTLCQVDRRTKQHRGLWLASLCTLLEAPGGSAAQHRGEGGSGCWARPTPFTAPLSVLMLVQIPGNSKSHVHFMIRTCYLSPTLTTNKGQRSMDQRLPVSTPASFPLFIQPLLATLVWSGKTVLRQMSSSLSHLQGLPGKGILVVTLHLVSALLGFGPSSVWSCGLISHFYCPTMRWRKAPQSLIMNSSKDRTWSQNLV